MKSDGAIVLTGRVYVHGVLEDAFIRLRVPAKPNRGDLQMHSHLDQAGHEARKNGRKARGYSGVLRVNIFDGSKWRTFMLAKENKEIGPEIRHFKNIAERNVHASQIIKKLSAYKGLSCVWKNGGFAIDHKIPRLQSTATTPIASSKPNTAASKPAQSRANTQKVKTGGGKAKARSPLSKQYRNTHGQRHLF